MTLEKMTRKNCVEFSFLSISISHFPFTERTHTFLSFPKNKEDSNIYYCKVLQQEIQEDTFNEHQSPSVSFVFFLCSLRHQHNQLFQLVSNLPKRSANRTFCRTTALLNGCPFFLCCLFPHFVTYALSCSVRSDRCEDNFHWRHRTTESKLSSNVLYQQFASLDSRVLHWDHCFMSNEFREWSRKGSKPS